MSKLKKVLALFLAVVFTASMFAGCGKKLPSTDSTEKSGSAAVENTKAADNDPAASFTEKKIRVAGAQSASVKAPSNDILTPIWREKTKVVVEVVTRPDGTPEKDWTQMMIAGGTLPEVLTGGNFGGQPDVKKLLKTTNSIKELKVEDALKYMPRFAKKLERYGVTLQEYLEANKIDGKLLWIPYEPTQSAFPKLRDLNSDTFVDSFQLAEPYGVYMRDDILKKIFPDVKTEEELRRVYVQKGGKLDWEDMSDIPIDNMEQLQDYLRKVKALGMKVGEKPVIPAHPNRRAESPSVIWSMLTATGQLWWGADFGVLAFKGDQMTYIPEIAEWKGYIKWMNDMYNEGLLDPSWAIQKEDQKASKIKNGEYAVFNFWENENNVVSDARKLSKDEKRGYGFRRMPLFRSTALESKYQTHQYQPVSLYNDYSIAIVTNTVKDSDMPQIYNWLDWNLSDEADSLRYWGTPDMYTGEGKDRRFKPEFKSVEDYYLTGKQGEKDELDYGMIDYNGTSNFETQGIKFLQGTTYDLQPKAVYPKNPTLDDDIDVATRLAIRRHYLKDMIWFTKKWVSDDIAADEDWVKATAKGGIWSDNAQKSMAKALVAKPAEFDKLYDEYYKAIFTPEIVKGLEKIKGKWKDIYKNQIDAEIQKGQKIQ